MRQAGTDRGDIRRKTVKGKVKIAQENVWRDKGGRPLCKHLRETWIVQYDIVRYNAGGDSPQQPWLSRCSSFACECVYCTWWILPSHFWRPQWVGWSPCQHLWWWSLWWWSQWMQTLSCSLLHHCLSCWKRSCLMPQVELFLLHTHSTHRLRSEGEDVMWFWRWCIYISLEEVDFWCWMGILHQYGWQLHILFFVVFTQFDCCINAHLYFHSCCSIITQIAMQQQLTVLVWFGAVWSAELWVHRRTASRTCFRAGDTCHTDW